VKFGLEMFTYRRYCNLIVEVNYEDEYSCWSIVDGVKCVMRFEKIN
jgi:hypothetical protein